MTTLDSLKQLPEITGGEQIVFTALVVDIKLQQTQTGKDYARVYLRDDKASTSVPLWDMSVESAAAVYNIDTIYTFGATTDIYKGETVVKKIISATEVTDNSIVRRLKQYMFKSATEVSLTIVYNTLASLADTVYAPYLEKIYGNSAESEEAAKLCKAYASINYHDNYPGGFINHVGGMLGIAIQLRDSYLAGRCESIWDVDWDYVFAAIMLHDIGKLQTYAPVTDYTIRFRDDCMLDHNTIGVGMLYGIHEAVESEKKLSEKVFQRLAYTICYHDILDKLYTHKHVEDKIISYIDGIDATLAVACHLEA